VNTEIQELGEPMQRPVEAIQERFEMTGNHLIVYHKWVKMLIIGWGRALVL
jgi:hypothetical protein